jgi:hypothetical protein
MVKREGVESKPELGVPNHGAQVVFDEFTVSAEEVAVILAGGDPQEPAYFTNKRGRVGGRLPLVPIVLGVLYHCIPEPSPPGSWFVFAGEAVQVDATITVSGGHVFKKVEGGVRLVVLSLHGGVEGFVFDCPSPRAHLGGIMVMTGFQIKLGGKD